MKVSDLIRELKKFQVERGDLEVWRPADEYWGGKDVAEQVTYKRLHRFQSVGGDIDVCFIS